MLRLPTPELPHEPPVALVTLEKLNGYLPEHYVALVRSVGCTPHEALQNLEQHAMQHARTNHAEAARHNGSAVGTYVVLGLRMTAGISSSGQPEWLAYGTLTLGRRSYTLVESEPAGTHAGAGAAC